MTGVYVREYYRVPAQKGMPIMFRGRPGVIVGFKDQYLRVLMDGETHPIICHPVWEIEYLTTAESEEAP